MNFDSKIISNKQVTYQNKKFLLTKDSMLKSGKNENNLKLTMNLNF